MVGGYSRAAMLFAYQPHAGSADRFHEGYRAHLEWHRSAGDTLLWYGWEVMTGTRLGLFIDGTFGRPFRVLDQRVDPAGDAADFAATAGPHAMALFRTAYQLMGSVSTDTPLEDGRPTPIIEAVTYRVQPGREARFEAIIASTASIAAGNLPPFTWYRLVNGDVHPTYLLLIHLNGFSAWDAPRADLAGLAAVIPTAPLREHLSEELAATVAEIASEVWRYLPASSLIPER